jgi:hypothetical protein
MTSKTPNKAYSSGRHGLLPVKALCASASPAPAYLAPSSRSTSLIFAQNDTITPTKIRIHNCWIPMPIM